MNKLTICYILHQLYIVMKAYFM